MTVKPRNIKTNKDALRRAASTNRKRIHVVPTKDGWSLKKEGAMRSSGTYSSKDTAIQAASNIKNFDGLIIIHQKDGSIVRRAER